MSAYQVSGEHIAYLLAVGSCFVGDSYANVRIYRTHNLGDCMEPGTNDEELFAILAGENAASVGYRYNEDTEVVPFVQPKHAHVQIVGMAAVARAMKAIQGYEYQSCEHPGWRDSHAHEYCQRLRAALIRRIPGFGAAYEAADTWHVHDQREAIAAK